MAARGRIPKPGGGEGEESSSTRKKKEDVLNQARAVLRQSQQFRPPAADKKNNNLSSRLAFQQQAQEDFWSPSGVVVDTTSHHQQQRYSYEGQAKPSRFHKDEDSGLPFRDAMRKSPVSTLITSQKTGGSQASSSSTTIDTTDLKVSSDSEATQSDSESSGGRSVSSVKRTKVKKGVKLNVEPLTVKLTPLAPGPTAVETSKPGTGESGEDTDGQESIIAPPDKFTKPPSANSARTLGLVKEDELGFSRALLKKSEHDPHWFEKALLVRGESISEAAYKAFKVAQAAQEDSEKDDARMGSHKHKKKKPIFSNFTDPEYTADWISDAGEGEDQITEVDEVTDIPESEYVDDDLHPEEIAYDEGGGGDGEDMPEVFDFADDNEVTSVSLVKTASELEASGVLDEIAANLHTVLEISENPESQGVDLARMTDEERSFAMEYDNALQEDSEPLKSIFNDIFQNPDATPEAKTEEDAKSTMTTTSKSASVSRSRKQDSQTGSVSNTWIQYEGEEEYENTFIQATTSSSTNKSSTSKRSISSTARIQLVSKDQGGKAKKGSTYVSLNKSKAKTDISSQTQSKSLSEKHKSSSSSVKSKASGPIEGKSSKTSGPVEGKSSKTSSIASSSKRQVSIAEREPHPSSRYQKNIQSILEKEVYQKELKRRRSQKLREERSQERLKLVAKESLERNKKSSWKDPSYTEILLPELFKYKSVSGLQAARAKRATGVTSPMSPPVNFGAPYFSFNGALSASDQMGSAGMLATAQVESLDIPDLVREVLASNERMYKMTIEAGKQMAKVYKNKVRVKTATSRNK